MRDDELLDESCLHLGGPLAWSDPPRDQHVCAVGELPDEAPAPVPYG